MELDKRYIKKETIEGRTFRIEIYDDIYGFAYTEIYEELRPKKHLFDSNYAKRIRKYYVEDAASTRRIEYAAEEIAKYIEETRVEENFKKILDKWADIIV